MAQPARIAVIGCGNIGSRHLQALALFEDAATIYAVEPAVQARKTAEERVGEVGPGEHLDFRYIEAIGDLPSDIDVAVIATGAKPRRMLTEALLDHASVKHLILEKFLFQSLADHDAIGALLAEKGVNCFVNTPRRMWPAYQELRNRLSGATQVTVQVELGKAISMSSNAIHFIDLAAFLSGNAEGYALSGQDLVQEGSSRHEGMLEFGGVMEGKSADGHRFSCTARPALEAPQTITIMSDKLRALIDEARGKGWVADEASDWQWQPFDVSVVYQSGLTQLAAKSLLATGSCDLPSYEESARLHKQCLMSFFEALGEHSPSADQVCPVT